MWQSGGMSKGAQVVLADGVFPSEAQRIRLVLASVGIDAALHYEMHGTASVLVADEDYDEALDILEDDFSEQRETSLSDNADPFAGKALPAPSHWFGRGAVQVLGLLGGIVAVFVSLHYVDPGPTRSRLLEFGAIDSARIERGEYWRFVTALFIHFDLAHLASNTLTYLLIAPPVAHLLGGWRFVFVFIAGGIGGNLISHELAPIVGLKAGASGAIAGLIGVLGGLAVRGGSTVKEGPTWRRFVAMIALYGFLVGFGPGRDNVAHLGGLITGFLVAYNLEPLSYEPELRDLNAPDRPPSA